MTEIREQSSGAHSKAAENSVIPSENPYDVPRARDERDSVSQPANSRLIVAIALSLIVGLATFLASFFLYYNHR